MSRQPRRTALSLSLAMALASLSINAMAIGLDAAQVRSALGEPLRLIVPLRLEPTDVLGPQCVAASARPIDEFGAAIGGVRAHLEVNDSGARIVVLSRAPVYEPAIRVQVEVRCAVPVSREYTLLLDPPVGPNIAIDSRAADAPPQANLTTPAAGALPTAPIPSQAVTTKPAPRAEGKSAAASVARPARPRSAQATGDAHREGVASKEPASEMSKQRVAPSRDRLTLAEPRATGGLRLSDQLGAAGPLGQADDKLRAEQARLASQLRGTESAPAPSPREVELINQLQTLGQEIQALKGQLAEQSRRIEADRSGQVSVAWVYGLGGVALLSLVLSGLLFLRSRRTLEQRRPAGAQQWWDDTLMRTDAPSADASAVGTATMPSSEADRDTVYPGARNTLTRTSIRGLRNIDDSDFPERPHDASIEVKELGATQVMHMLKQRLEASGELPPSSDAVPPAPSVAPETPASPATGSEGAKTRQTSPKLGSTGQIEAIDFNLDLPFGEASAEEALATTVPLEPLDLVPQEAPPVDLELPMPDDVWTQAAAADAPAPALAAMPAFIAKASKGMSWSDARQAQDYLREIGEAIEQADAYLNAGQAESASSVLRKVIADKVGSPRAPWLMLLELYRKVEKRDAYEVLAGRFEEHFGRRPPAWDKVALTPQPGLDSDPDLLQAIWAKWGAAESMSLLAQLLYDPEVPGDRYFNLTLQRDLLNFVKICPLDGG